MFFGCKQAALSVTWYHNSPPSPPKKQQPTNKHKQKKKKSIPLHHSRFQCEELHDVLHVSLGHLSIHVHQEDVQLTKKLDVNPSGPTHRVRRDDLARHTKGICHCLMGVEMNYRASCSYDYRECNTGNLKVRGYSLLIN